MQTIRQLDQNNPHILTHGEEGLPQCLGDRIIPAAAGDPVRLIFQIDFLSAAIGLTLRLGSRLVFGMLVAPGDPGEGSKLGHPIHKPGDLLPKFKFDFRQSHVCVFDRIMQ